MKTISRNLAILGLSLLTLAGAKAQSTIAQWTFNNDTVATNYNPAPSVDNSVGAVSAASIGMGIYATPAVGTNAPDVVLGKSSDTGSNGVSDTSNVWRIRAQAGGSSGTNAANGWSSLAPIGTQGAQFNVDTTGFSGISVSFDWYVTTAGEANLQFEYTTNVNAATPIWNNVALALNGSDLGLQLLSNNGSDSNLVTGSYVSDNILTGGNKSGQDWFTGLTAVINDTNAANNPNFAFEIVNAATGVDDVSTAGTALNNTSGNWRFDNVTVTAAPEPSTYALLISGVAMLIGFRIRRSRAKN